MTNIAIRASSVNGGIYFQNMSGTGTYAFMNTTGTSITGTLTTSGQIVPATTTDIIQAAGPMNNSIMIQGNSSHTGLAFHAMGYFGANFGMASDGNFYMGGWSHGAGTVYQFFTTRVAVVTSGRAIFAGDASGTTAMTDTVANSFHTGFQYNTGFFITAFRCRYVQGLSGGAWFTYNFAS